MIVESKPMYTHEHNVLVFWRDVAQNELASAQSGKPEFDDVLYVRVTSPGSKDTNVFEVERNYAEGFPHPIHKKKRLNKAVYDKYRKYIDQYVADGAVIVTEGTPIEQWALVTARQALTLKHNGVHSVEALANLSDSAIAAVGMGSRALVQKAKDWLAQAQNSATAMQAQEQARRTQEQLDYLRQQMADLGEALNALPPEAKAAVQEDLKKRGRAKAAA